MENLQSRPYKPDPDMCCEACVFGRGEHAVWCMSKAALTEACRKVNEGRQRRDVKPLPAYKGSLVSATIPERQCR